MTISLSEISKLPTKPEDIGSQSGCLEVLQCLIRSKVEEKDALHLKSFVIAVIENEIKSHDGEGYAANQTVLNVAAGAYYHVLKQHKLEESFFKSYFEGEACLKSDNDQAFQLLFAALQTEYSKVCQSEKLKEKCLECLIEAIENDKSSIIWIIKALNILFKKFPFLSIYLSLEQVYFCLQTNFQGIREEVLKLFSFCCRDPEQAFEYFQIIVEFWPWTSRNKIYLLSCIFDQQNFNQFSQLMELNEEEFFEGIRLSLSYKSLLTSSQYLVASLSKQNNQQLLELSVKILSKGNLCELQNFYAQWFGRIKQKNELFHLLKQESQVVAFLFETNENKDNLQYFRIIVILSLFSQQIFEISKLLFFKVSTELITNCFDFEPDAQLLIFRFFVDNIANFAIEDCLHFFLKFIQTHKGIESSQFRNTILGRIPNIINYIAKYYKKMRGEVSCFLEQSIVMFFRDLQKLVEENIECSIYQPKIFALKLLEILLKSLYAKEVVKNAKNCSMEHNKYLGAFLIELEVFNANAIAKKLLSLLEDPPGYEDALELKVNLLKILNQEESSQSFDICQNICKRVDVDECSLSYLYAKVAINMDLKNEQLLELYKHCWQCLYDSIEAFKADPLNACKTRNHLYGYLSVMNEIIHSNRLQSQANYAEVLVLLQDITDKILEMLNLANQNSTAASFQDMDESLEILVKMSSFTVDDHEAARKFLLMSFWFTLKASCDLATTIGCNLVLRSFENDEQFEHLEQCLKILVAVLTKCRHKGAIETAGVCIGKLTKTISSASKPTEKPYSFLYKCLDVLFEEREQVSTTRRGAGFAIMFLHLIKNEQQCSRPLLRKAIATIMQKLKSSQSNGEISFKVNNVDRLEALTLHYLCVLVKDTELREAMHKYQNDIILAAIANIDNTEWTICNAALQLFGALIPKIVGQKTATEFEEPLEWETSEITYDEIQRKLPQTCQHILEFCGKGNNLHDPTTRSFILFLGFLSKVEYVRKSQSEEISETIKGFRELMWSLLSHQCDKVRKLAAVCLVRLHELRIELPKMLSSISEHLYAIENENFFEALIYILYEGLHKLAYESKFTLPKDDYSRLLEQIRINLVQGFIAKNFKPYTFCKLLDLFKYLKLNTSAELREHLSRLDFDANGIGFDLWLEKYQSFKN